MLVADDHQDTREMYAWCMRASGWVVAEVADGLDALSVATTFLPDVIVMDLHLPLLDGVEAIRSLKLDERTRSVPIVACTGMPWIMTESAARDAGCDAFIRKPFLPDDLCDLLGKLVTPRPGP